MVSFSCESCGDVLTKKKLDAHRGQCCGASFTCLDCMIHFRGTDYRLHTSCISEAQKYQGALYKEKPSKAKKSVTISDSTSLVPRRAYVEDVPDVDLDNQLAPMTAPPHAPSPPPAASALPINVFDFLVDETPNASRLSLGDPKEQMRMVAHAPPIFKSETQSPKEHDVQNESHEFGYEFDSIGYAYGTKPVKTNGHDTYQTPAPKTRSGGRGGRTDSIYELEGREGDRKSTDKKRKRQVEDLDLTQARRPSQEVDETMPDADSIGVPILHSGLTGGLHRLLSKSKFPPSPDYSGGDNNDPGPLSPVKRKKEIPDKSRGRTSTALVKIRKVRRTSDESRPRKHHRSHKHVHSNHDRDRDHEHAEHSDRPKQTLKAIEYPGNGHSQADEQNQMVVFRTRAELFLSFVNKGPESEHGCSINKALKRYHRERGERGMGLGRGEEEKELWKTLRLRRNERGEIVLLT